ncbi:protein NUCLEAR FUSION DEFECTIVE 2 [Selaginella moellendorffii]|nr:protein NUCLEAR FUSION DEFECTIVE 2 [Selaginella moellendorffii]|eukprot:XP_002990009.2 protein NUCLEAR FUSION DEFECTIVE 2 [Selaginella moellendorffii]
MRTVWFVFAPLLLVQAISVKLKETSDTLEDELGYKFNDSTLLQDALTHSSYSRHNNGPLHLLGVSIIRASVYKHYLAKNRDATKEELEAMSSSLSSTTACARRASGLGLDKLIRADVPVDRKSDKVLAVAFHVLFGAIAMDGSADQAMSVFWKIKSSAVI